MSRYKHASLKKRISKRGRQTKWAPVWTVPKKYGVSKKVHPARHTTVKRSWRRQNMKV
jgi:ribosomal protein L39E